MGRVASLLFSFWCFDAKGGEEGLLGPVPGFAWDGHKLARLSFLYACVHVYLSYFVFIRHLLSMCL